MPTIRERNQVDKIKNQVKQKGSRPVQQEARRVMPAKLKKELAQQKRGSNFTTEQPHSDSTNTPTEAVNQVEQTTGAAVQETGQQIKRGTSRAVTKAKKDRQRIKEQQEQPKEPEYPSDIPGSGTPESSIPETVSQEHTPRAGPQTQSSSLPQESPATASAPWTRSSSEPPSNSMPKAPTPSPAHNVSPKTQTIHTSTNVGFSYCFQVMI